MGTGVTVRITRIKGVTVYGQAEVGMAQTFSQTFVHSLKLTFIFVPDSFLITIATMCLSFLVTAPAAS